MVDKIIVKVRESHGQKTVTVPKGSGVKKGDYVEVKKIK